MAERRNSDGRASVARGMEFNVSHDHRTISALLSDEAFLTNVGEIIAALAKAQVGIAQPNANSALDALGFTIAIFQEADPDYADDDELGFAADRTSYDLHAMLRHLREEYRQSGVHFLERLTGSSGSLN